MRIFLSPQVESKILFEIPIQQTVIHADCNLVGRQNLALSVKIKTLQMEITSGKSLIVYRLKVAKAPKCHLVEHLRRQVEELRECHLY